MTPMQNRPVLVTGATGRLGRIVVDDLVTAGVPVRALVHRAEAATMSANVEVVTGDFTVPESLSQVEQVRIIGEVLGRQIAFAEMPPDDFRRETEGGAARPVVEMLLPAWGAAIGRSAFITSTVGDILESPPRTFRRWVADHASAFTEGPASDDA